jgi:hypothetical protein
VARPPSIRLTVSRVMDAHVLRIEKAQKDDEKFLLSPDDALVLERLAKAEAALDKRAPQKDEPEGDKPDPKEALARLKSGTSPAAVHRGAEGDED